MKKITILAALALAAGCSTQKDVVVPHLVVTNQLAQGVTLAAGEANPSATLNVSGTCLGTSAEEAKSETVTVEAGATQSIELCHGDFAVTAQATENWEADCPDSVSLGERTDLQVSCVLQRKATSSDNQAVLDAIAALQTAINGGDPASIASALAALMTAIEGVNGAVGDLADQIAALQAQALRLIYPGSVIWTVLDSSGQPIANATVTETNVSWASLPAGENAARTCNTNASGECEVLNLYLQRDLRFEVKATNFRTEASINLILEPGTPSVAVEVRLQAAGNSGDLVGQNFVVTVNGARTITGAYYQVQSDGSLKPVTAADGLSCTVSSGATSVGVDVDCTTLQGLAVGCGGITASLGGKSTTSKVRVTNADGTGAYCP